MKALLFIIFALALSGCGSPDRSPTWQTPAEGEVASSTGLEALLSGETLARYRALPPAYRHALQVYAYVGVSSDLIPAVVKDKMEQWRDAAAPLVELAGNERLGRFENIEPQSHEYASLLGAYYALLLNTESSEARRAAAMGELVNVMAPPPPPNTFGGLDSDEASDPDPSPSPMLEWPDPDTFLTPTALARLHALPPGLQKGLRNPLGVGDGEQRYTGLLKDIAAFMPRYEVFLLKAGALPELPTLEDVLTGEDRVTFLSLPAEARERADESFSQTLVFSYITAAYQPHGAATVSSWPEEKLAEMALATLDYILSISNIEHGQASSGVSI